MGTQSISTTMKLAIASAFTLALADKASIDRQLMAQVRNSSLRAFSGNIQTAVERLDEYGCWCYFYDNVGRGKGTPVDEIDGFCKTLADGYQCAMIDGENEGESCVPWEVAYQPGSGQGPERFQTCQDANAGNACAARACSVKGVFGEKSCCGAYPNRFPYKTLDGDRACCGSR